MEISYKKVGDYYIPEMVFPNAKLDKNIGKYGRLGLKYLKHNHMDIYTILLMDDKLNEHLLEIEKEAKEQVKILVENMCKKENVTEKLKEKYNRLIKQKSMGYKRLEKAFPRLSGVSPVRMKEMWQEIKEKGKQYGKKEK